MKNEMTVELVDAVERLIEVVGRLDESMSERVEKITATIDISEREAEWMRRLEQAEARIAELSATSSSNNMPMASGRKTVHALVAKGEEKNAALEVALSSLTVEQRFAVKAELLRAGVLQ